MAHERREIKSEDLSLVRNIANSRMARVDLCRWKQPGKRDTLVAKKSLLSGNALQFKKQLESEIEILFDVKHENIVETIGFVLSESEFGLIMNFYKFGSYHKVFVETNYENPRTDDAMAQLYPLKLRILKEVASAINYLHSKRPTFYLHLDIKADNVLMSDELHAILTDFGLSEAKTISRLSRQSTCSNAGGTAKGTLYYISPEHLANPRCKSTVKTDVYAFGILAWQVLADANPYDDIGENFNESLVLHHIQANNCRPELERLLPCVSENFRKNIVENSWLRDPTARPTFQELCAQIEQEIQGNENFSQNLQLAIEAASKFILTLPNHDQSLIEWNKGSPSTAELSAPPISWGIVSQAIQRRGGVSRLNYGNHPIVAATEMQFHGLKMVWNCKCMDVKTGIFTETKKFASPVSACEIAACRLIRIMIDKGIYPRPIDEDMLRK